MSDNPNGENFEELDGYGLDSGDRWSVMELVGVLEVLDKQQTALERLAHDDPVGAVWFGSDDSWVDRQLKRDTRPK